MRRLFARQEFVWLLSFGFRIEEFIYSLRPILLFANTDVSITKMCLDTSILAKNNMGRRGHNFRIYFFGYHGIGYKIYLEFHNFITCLTLIHFCYPVIFVYLPNKLILSYHFISFLLYKMK
jgi:hypothetical protein